MKKNNFMSSLLQFAIGPLGAAIIGFITVPITTWLVSPEQFGLTTMFTLLQTLITSFIYLGLDQAYVREYNSRRHSKSKIFFNASIIPFLVSLVIAIIIILFKNLISIYLFDEVNLLLMNFLALWIPFVVIERFLLLNIRMQEKGLQYSLYNILTKLFLMILTISLLLLFERSYTSIVLGSILAQIISCIILIIMSRKQFLFSKGMIDYNLIKKMLRFGLPLLPAAIIVWVLNSTDRLVLNRYTTIDEIGIYFAAMKLVTTLNMIQSIFATFWVPMAYRWHEEGVSQEQYEKVSYGVGIFMGIMFIGVLLLKKIFIMIFSPEYAEAQYILPFLLFTPIMYTMSETTTLGISFSRKTYLNIIISFVAATVNILINLLLVPYIGGIGAAIGTGLAYITFFWCRTLLSRKYWYKFDLKFYYMNTIFLFVVAFFNIVVKSDYIYIWNTSFMFVYILINYSFISKIINLKDLVRVVNLKSNR